MNNWCQGMQDNFLQSLWIESELRVGIIRQWAGLQLGGGKRLHLAVKLSCLEASDLVFKQPALRKRLQTSRTLVFCNRERTVEIELVREAERELDMSGDALQVLLCNALCVAQRPNIWNRVFYCLCGNLFSYTLRINNRVLVCIDSFWAVLPGC